MVYVGVDVAKHTHYACVMNDKRSILTQPFPFTNNESGFDKFLNAFAKLPKDELIIGLESTSVYGENLMAFLARLNYSIALINPIETSSMRKGRIRNTKTDKIDSKLICKYLSKEEYRLLHPKELQLLQLRGLCRFRQTLKKSNARLKTQLVSYLDLSFPEHHTAFSSSVHGKGSYAVLLEFLSASAIAKANITKLTNVLRNASRGHFSRSKADMLKNIAERSVASSSDINFQIKQTIKQIQLIESQLDDVENHICTVFNTSDSIIRTVPGIGSLNGSMIISEIGDINRFSNPNQLIAVTFNKYYDEKLAQKGRHYAALGHVAGKLTRVIFKMLKDNVAFDLP